MSFESRCLQAWYEGRWWLHLLRPFSVLFSALSATRKYFQQTRAKEAASSLPDTLAVVVVGNITLGGTGKTPLLMALVKRLQAEGFKPGVISRGYGRDNESSEAVYLAGPESTALDLGDEPYLIYQQCACPLAVGRNRVAALQALVKNHQCDVVLSDDGLQHYRLPRDIEIAVVDGARGLGNGLCLPAGPLRESGRRLESVDFVVVNGPARDEKPIPAPIQYSMNLEPQSWHSVSDVEVMKPLSAFVGEANVLAVAGIGNPQRFFNTLEGLNLSIEPRAFADHYAYQAEDIPSNVTVLMTAKDAVKCRDFASEHCWYLAVEAELPEHFWSQFLSRVRERVLP